MHSDVRWKFSYFLLTLSVAGCCGPHVVSFVFVFYFLPEKFPSYCISKGELNMR